MEFIAAAIIVHGIVIGTMAILAIRKI